MKNDVKIFTKINKLWEDYLKEGNNDVNKADAHCLEITEMFRVR